jgi:hypothetical protein
MKAAAAASGQALRLFFCGQKNGPEHGSKGIFALLSK